MSSIIASNLPESTTKEQIQKFFEFCGKIQRIEDSLKLSSYEGEKVFLVTFVESSAVSTALLLDDAELNGSKIKILQFNESPGGGPPNAVDVSGPPDYLEKPADVEARIKPAKGTNAEINVTGVAPDGKHEDIEQELKPKAAIFAEYLSQGYVLSDPLLQKAIDYDSRHGYSEKFRKFLEDVDSKYKIHDKSEEIDQKLGVSKYVNKALATDVGSKIHKFYSDFVHDTKQINDEALRLAELKKQESAAGTSTTAVASTDEKK